MIQLKKVIHHAAFAPVIIFLGVLGVLLTALSLGAFARAVNVRDRVVIEAGSPIPPLSAFLFNPNSTSPAEFITDMSELASGDFALGVFPIEIVYNRRAYSSTLVIQDTIPPQATAQNRTAVTNDPLDPFDFIAEYSDATQVRAVFAEPVDFSQPGTQVVWVMLEDEAHNQTRLAALLHLIDGARTVHREYGQAFAAVTLDEFLFSHTERQNAIFMEFDEPIVLADDEIYPRVIPVYIHVLGRSERFYIEISDTTPPTAEAAEVVGFLGDAMLASHFVKNVQDASEYRIFFQYEPDWDVLGEQTAHVIVEDIWGNALAVSVPFEIIEDTEAPVFHGLRTLYVARGQAVAFRRGVTAVDSRGFEVHFTIDASGVDTTVIGRHYAYYEATSFAGNIARVRVPVVVTETDPEVVYALAQVVLDGIIREGMTQLEQVRAVYRWVRSSISYEGSGPHDDRVTGAHNGLTRRRGDCFTYYATAGFMLDMLGIPNITMQRVGGTTRHWWMLVDAGYGWHHFDATPHSDRATNTYHMTQTRADVLTTQRGARAAYYVFDPERLPEGVVIVP